ncbi:polysaccharide lyase beta-sandwich domain-containing protein [Streptomyces sp. CC219B]|uniref:polysaccharide lyase beta-sandwich domain-containing protein n=1 Tax=Streptomyces sp. CC219B TaxID=3044574 RepID=UPI0024A8A8FF|nr:polysaccharide lyase beta-sandwich domain-containing protein [Streptomyces sp. CC219B]
MPSDSSAPSEPSAGWSLLLRRLEFIAYPAAAGAAFTLLALGVVTWLPALAAMARALQRWRADGDGRCFTGTFAAFPHYWRALWRQGLAATAALAVLAANLLLLFGRPSPVAFALLAGQVGIAATLTVLCVSLAARAALDPGAPVADWVRGAVALGFGSPALHGPARSATLDKVRWLHLDGTGGYVFPRPARLRALREERTATWREINLKYGTDTPVTRPYLTLWHDHGPAPEDAGYYWLQAPAASAARTRLWSQAPPLALVADSTAVHAVRRGADGLFAANFWAAGRAGQLACDGPASVLVRPSGRTVTVALSDPTQLRDRVVLDLAVPALKVVSADTGVRAERTPGGTRITAETAGLHGATVTITLTRS